MKVLLVNGSPHKEGCTYTALILGKNMAWFLKCKEAGEKAGITLPEQEVVSFTNFIRE